MKLTNWRQLSDGGPGLVPCLDFPGGRAVAGFPDLAAGVPAGASFLLNQRASADPLAVCVDRWVAELAATGRPVRAVLGFCSGTALATRVADAIAATGPAPRVVLFDAVPTTGESLAGQLPAALETSARYLTADELADARELSEQLAATYPDDLPRIAAAVTEAYDRLMRAVADRLSLREHAFSELTEGFAAYLDYLLLTSEGGFDLRSATPLFVCSADYEPPVADARTITLDIDHADLLRAPQARKLVADLLTGEHSW
jgi:hypothetical protein